MEPSRLTASLSGYLSAPLAQELVSDFIKLRSDCATGTFERASLGKFVEVFVQCLQFLARGSFDPKPDVDGYLCRHAEHENLPEGLRICAARLARSIYTFRNKRNIAHKNAVDPNRFDLAVAHLSAAWIMAELVRNAVSITMHEAGRLIELLQTPVGTLVEEIDGVRLVHANTSVRGELLILLHSHYPERVLLPNILESLFTRPTASVKNRLGELRTEKVIFGDSKLGFRLTVAGHFEATQEIARLQKISPHQPA